MRNYDRPVFALSRELEHDVAPKQISFQMPLSNQTTYQELLLKELNKIAAANAQKIEENDAKTV